MSKAHQPHGLGLKPQPPLCPDWWVQNLGTRCSVHAQGAAQGALWSDQGRRVGSGSWERPGGQVPTMSSSP